ncbi:MAG: thermonuclease family protein [Phyllobacteriaceae bacterium]|nr:thermonuclease family protein [Phyllobacteriaceae bacterium]
MKGLDAPEFSQICRRDNADYGCGREARGELKRLIGGQKVVCDGWERDKYNRLLASCRAGATDLNASMVANGWAVAYGGYAAEEAAARQAKRGLWAGTFDRPSSWRAAHGDVPENEHTTFAAIVNALKALFGIS